MVIDSQPKETDHQPQLARVRELYAEVSRRFARNPFAVHPVFSGAHAQTLAAYAWPRRRRLFSTAAQDEMRLFKVDEGVQVSAQCRWQPNKLETSTMVIWHGMEGSIDSVYMWSTAHKAFQAGFNVVRVNYRNCGGTEHLSPTLYHGGMSSDLAAVLHELIKSDGLKRIFPVGFSLGGNMVLKLAGEYGESAPPEIIATCVISPSVDLGASTALIMKRSNWIYHKNFVRSLKQRIQIKNRLHPELYNIDNLHALQTIRDFDECYTALGNGFTNADDYYYRASSVRVVEKIRIPTLIIHAKDDPFIPFEPLSQKIFSDNPYLLMSSTDRGGHVAFIAAASLTEDRFWAENRVVEFCQVSDSML